MKYFLLSLLILSNTSYAKAPAEYSEIETLSAEIENDITAVNECVPTVSIDKIVFCTGAELSLKSVDQLASKDNACSKMIEEHGYTVVKEGEQSKANLALWNIFSKGRKGAQAFHKEKIVFFRKDATKIECIQQFIHVLQWTSKNENALSPMNRDIKYKKLEALLLDASDEVDGAEDPGKVKDKSLYLQDQITLLNDYLKASDWADDKDVYVFLYRVCGKPLQCSQDELDTVIGNLFVKKEKLPWRFRNEIVNKAVHVVREKEEGMIDQVDFKSLDAKDLADINSLFDKSWDDLLSFVKSKNIKVYKFISSAKGTTVEPGKIPADILAKLEEPEKAELVSLLSYSKISSGYVMGKFLCNDKKKEKFILLTSSSSKDVVVHEYMHYLQSLKNPQFCRALTEQNNTAIDFKTGKISREQYESTILADKVLIWKTELEVYKRMSEHVSLSETENSNNKIQTIIYKTRLTKSDKKEVQPGLTIKKISFEEKHDLPVVKMSGNSFVLDMGAMDSVIAPRVAFKMASVDMISPITMKNVNNSIGESVEAPLVMINTPMELDGNKIPQSKWILANLKLPFADGVVGLDFFKGKEFVIYPKQKYIEITEFKTKPENSFVLQQNFNNEVAALEFVCPADGLVARLDTGSQVTGDVKTSLKDIVKEPLLSKEGYNCGKLNIAGKFDTKLQNNTLFSHGVGVNLGWNWIKKFKKVSVSLKDSWVSFE